MPEAPPARSLTGISVGAADFVPCRQERDFERIVRPLAPHADMEARQLHLDEMSRRATRAPMSCCCEIARRHPTRHPVVPRTSRRSSCSRALWSRTRQKVWKYLRSNWLSKPRLRHLRRDSRRRARGLTEIHRKARPDASAEAHEPLPIGFARTPEYQDRRLILAVESPSSANVPSWRIHP